MHSTATINTANLLLANRAPFLLLPLHAAVDYPNFEGCVEALVVRGPHCISDPVGVRPRQQSPPAAPGGDQPPVGLGQARPRGAYHEFEGADEQHPAAAEDVGQAPGGYRGSRKSQQVGVYRPLQSSGGGVEVPADVRQRGRDAVEVYRHHQGGQRHRHDRPPLAVAFRDQRHRGTSWLVGLATGPSGSRGSLPSGWRPSHPPNGLYSARSEIVGLDSAVGLRGDLPLVGEVVGYVLLALVAEEGDERLQFGVALADLAGGDHVRPARRTDEEAVAPGKVLHALDRLAGVHGEGGVHEPPVALEDAGHEAVGDALDEVLPHLATEYRRRLGGLHREELDPRVDLAEGLADAHQGASCAHTHDEDVWDLALGELGQDLRPQPHTVLLDVPLRLELRGTEVAVLPPELFRLGQSLVDVEVADLQDLGAEGAAYDGAFAGHPLGHDHEHPVAFDGGHHREGVAGVAARSLDYGVAGF